MINKLLYLFQFNQQGSGLKQMDKELTNFQKGLLRIQRMATAAGFGLRRLGQGMSMGSQNVIRSGERMVKTFADYEQGVLRLQRNTNIMDDTVFSVINKNINATAQEMGILLEQGQEFGIFAAKTGVYTPLINDLNALTQEIREGGDASGEAALKHAKLAKDLEKNFSKTVETLAEASLVLDNFSEGDTNRLLRTFTSVLGADNAKDLDKFNDGLRLFVAQLDAAARFGNIDEARIVTILEKSRAIFELSPNARPAMEQVTAYGSTIAELGEQSRTAANNITSFMLKIKSPADQAKFVSMFSNTSEAIGLSMNNLEDFNKLVFDNGNVINVAMLALQEYGQALVSGDMKKAETISKTFGLETKVMQRLSNELVNGTERFKQFLKQVGASDDIIAALTETSDKFKQSTQASLNRVRNDWTLLTADLSRIVLPIFRELIKIVKENAQALKNWIADPENKKRIKEFIELAPKMLIFGIVAGELIKLAGSLVLVISGLRNLTGVFSGLFSVAGFLFKGGALLVGITLLAESLFPGLIDKTINFGKELLASFNIENFENFKSKLIEGFKSITKHTSNFVKELKEASEFKNILEQKGRQGAFNYLTEQEMQSTPGISQDLAKARASELMLERSRGSFEIFADSVTDFYVENQGFFKDLKVQFGYLGFNVLTFAKEAFNQLTVWIGDLGRSLIVYLSDNFFLPIKEAFANANARAREHILSAQEKLTKMFDSIAGFIDGVAETFDIIATWLGLNRPDIDALNAGNNFRDPTTDDMAREELENLTGGGQTGKIFRKPMNLGGFRVGEAGEEALVPIDRNSSIPSLQKSISSGGISIKPATVVIQLDNREIGRAAIDFQIEEMESRGLGASQTLRGIGGT